MDVASFFYAYLKGPFRGCLVDIIVETDKLQAKQDVVPIKDDVCKGEEVDLLGEAHVSQTTENHNSILHENYMISDGVVSKELLDLYDHIGKLTRGPGFIRTGSYAKAFGIPIGNLDSKLTRRRS